MNPGADLDALTDRLMQLGVVALVVVGVGFVAVAMARSWWDNRRVAAPPRARGGAVEPIARVLRGASREWDAQLLAAGLMVKRPDGRLYRPRIVQATRSAVKIAPLPGSMPRWLHPSTTVHLSQIANRPVQVGQTGAHLVIQVN